MKIPGKITYTPNENIGKRCEEMHFTVFVPGQAFDDRDIRLEAIRAACTPFEIDGWKGNYSDGLNSNRMTKNETLEGQEGGWYRIRFTRFVEPGSSAEPEEEDGR